MAAIAWPEDELEAAAVRRALEAGTVHFRVGLGDEWTPTPKSSCDYLTAQALAYRSTRVLAP